MAMLPGDAWIAKKIQLASSAVNVLKKVIILVIGFS
jgi:hypothetical protein